MALAPAPAALAAPTAAPPGTKKDAKLPIPSPTFGRNPYSPSASLYSGASSGDKASLTASRPLTTGVSADSGNNAAKPFPAVSRDPTNPLPTPLTVSLRAPPKVGSGNSGSGSGSGSGSKEFNTLAITSSSVNGVRESTLYDPLSGMLT